MPRDFPIIDAATAKRHDSAMTQSDPKPRLRERVAARRRGQSADRFSDAALKIRQRWRVLGYGLQGVGIIALLLYVVTQYQQGFRNVDYRWILVPSLIFVAGRVIHLWLSIGPRRR